MDDLYDTKLCQSNTG